MKKLLIVDYWVENKHFLAWFQGRLAIGWRKVNKPCTTNSKPAMFHGLIDLKIEDFFALNQNSTRSHNFKLNVCYSRVNYRKYFFSNRTVRIWNNLIRGAVSDCARRGGGSCPPSLYSIQLKAYVDHHYPFSPPPALSPAMTPLNSS